MPSRKAGKAGKKKTVAKKKARSKATAVAPVDLEKMVEQLRQITAAAAKIIETANRMSSAAAQSAGARTFASRALRSTARALGCLDILVAAQIVQEAAGGPHNIDKPLTEIGLISDNERRIFQEDVFNGVLDAGCEINRGDIPNGANNTLREVRTAIRAAAR